MKLNTRGRYGVRLLTELARREPASAPVGLRSVAAATGLPMRYLEQIVRPLRRSGLIRARAGRTGGYNLARPASDIPLSEVFEATVGSIRLMACVDNPAGCARSATCETHKVWASLTGDLRSVLGRYSLADVAHAGQEPCQEPVASARRRTRSRRTRAGARER
jgi:Rrf2 family iron-sulfur cluster assembly transcriptional regulator